jgi:hypothetical protein
MPGVNPLGIGLFPPCGPSGAAGDPPTGATFGTGVQTLFNAGNIVIVRRELSVAELLAMAVTPLTLITPPANRIVLPLNFFVESNTRAAGMAAAPVLRLCWSGFTGAADALTSGAVAINVNAVDRYRLSYGQSSSGGGHDVGLSPPAVNGSGQALVVFGSANMVGGAGSRTTLTVIAVIVPFQVVP